MKWEIGYVSSSFASVIIKISNIPEIRTFRSSNLEEMEFMLRVPMITLSIFSLRIFLMFVIQLNSSLELVLLLSFGTSGSLVENSSIPL